MTGPNPATSFTYQDYAGTPDDERCELLGGYLLLVPPADRAHQRASIRLGAKLPSFVHEHTLVSVYLGPRDVALSVTDVVQPDSMFISNERSHIDTEGEVWGCPDLLVEITSVLTAERDRTTKRDLYARHGAREYWLVDPDTRTIEVSTAGGLGFETVAALCKGDTLVSPTLPGFSITLDDIF